MHLFYALIVKSEESGFLVEDSDYPGNIGVEVARHKLKDSGVYIAASGSHDEALKRCCSHSCIRALSAYNLGH